MTPLPDALLESVAAAAVRAPSGSGAISASKVPSS